MQWHNFTVSHRLHFFSPCPELYRSFITLTVPLWNINNFEVYTRRWCCNVFRKLKGVHSVLLCNTHALCRTTQSSRGCLQTFLIYPELIVPGPLSRDSLCVILCSCRHDTVFYYIKKCLIWLFFFLPYQAFHNSLKHSLAFLFITIPNFYDLKTSQEQTCNINSPYR